MGAISTMSTRTNFTMGYEAGLRDAKREEERRKEYLRRKKEYLRRKKLYFLKQRVAAVLMIIAAWAMLPLLDYDATAPVFITMMATPMMFTKQMVWIDDFQRECERRREHAKKRSN